jgi:coenzyme F420 hydrogenase subunit beta
MIKKALLETNLCSGCGACYAICPHDAINMKISLDGSYKPFIDFSKCNDCGLCERACPSSPANQKIMIDGLRSFIRCYISYSTDAIIRWKASSGGLVTTILLSLLEEGAISGAVVVKDDPRNPLKPLMTFVKSEEEIREAMGSKYCPVRPFFKVKDLVREPGKIAVVGLPCHIWAFKKLEEVDGRLRSKNFIHLGLFCGKRPNFYAVTYFLRKIAGVNERNVTRISYRGKGWPGKITVSTKQGKSSSFELSEWTHFAYYPHFIPIRCVLCYDITNQQADISLGDAWGLAHDNIGTSVIITRTPIGESVIQHLYDIGRLILREVKPEQISQGQGLEDQVKNSLIRAYIWQRIFHQFSPFTLSGLPRTSIKNWVFNLGYCTWLYIAQNRSIRILLCNTTPQTLKILKLIRGRLDKQTS